MKGTEDFDDIIDAVYLNLVGPSAGPLFGKLDLFHLHTHNTQHIHTQVIYSHSLPIFSNNT
jgi:hypothetical protein